MDNLATVLEKARSDGFKPALPLLTKWRASNTPSDEDRTLASETLQGLDPSTNTTVVVFLLSLLVAGREKSLTARSEEFNMTRKTLLAVKPSTFKEIKIQIFELCRFLSCVSEENAVAARAALPAVRSIVKIVSEEEWKRITPAHLAYLHLCLETKNYRMAACCSLENLTDAEPLMPPADIMRYLYYCGRVRTGLKQYGRAVDAYNSCIIFPTTSFSLIAARAFQQLVVVHLIEYGKPPAIPKFVPFSVRASKSSDKPYTELCAAFRKGMKELKDCVESNRKEYEADGTLGLVKQAVEAFKLHKVKALGKTYLSLKLCDVAEEIGLTCSNEEDARNEVEMVLFRLARTKRVDLELDLAAEVVQLKDAPIADSHYEIVESKLTQLQDLLEQVKKLDLAVTKSGPFLKNFSKKRQSMLHPSSMEGIFPFEESHPTL